MWLMAGIAAGTIGGGLASDIYGRRPVLIAALLLAAAGALASSMQPHSWNALLLGRLVVGLGSGAALVICRVALREAYEASEQLRISSYLSLSVATTTLSAPLLGSWIYASHGLQGTLLASLTFALGVLILGWRGFPETRAVHRVTQLGTRARVAAMCRLLLDPHFVQITAILSLGWAVLVLFGASLPTLLQVQFGQDRFTYAFGATAVYVAYFVGIRLSRRLLPRVAAPVQMRAAAAALVTSVALLFALEWSTGINAAALLTLASWAFFLLGFVLPLAQLLVLRDSYANFGAVASLFYFIELLSGVVILWTFLQVDYDPLIKLLVACGTVSLVLTMVTCFYCTSDRSRERHNG